MTDDRRAEIQSRVDNLAYSTPPWTSKLVPVGSDFTIDAHYQVDDADGDLVAVVENEPIAELLLHAPADLEHLLETVAEALELLATARHRHRAYPDAANPNAYCLNCLTGQKEVGSNFPEYVKWPCPDAVALGMAEEVNP